MEPPDRVRTRLLVNELVFDAEADLGKGNRLLKGDGRALSEKDKTGLIHFSQRLERNFETIKGLRPQEGFLLGIVWYLAEAPVGMEIQTHQGVCPEPKTIAPLTITSPCKDLEAECSADPGDQDDDDGITLLGGKCDYVPYEIWHDAGSSHGFCKSIQCLGAYSDSDTDCTGRCGPGCPTVVKVGAYALDCGEHDVCCGLHGNCFAPIGVVCADEFRDAFLDTVCLENAIDCEKP